MQLEISVELKNLIPPLTDDEYLRLEQCILSEGCRDAIVIWQGIIVDGHNRYEICKKHGINFSILEKDFADNDIAKEWVIRNQFARRNLSAYDRSLLALKLEVLFREKAKENQGTRTDIPQKSAKSYTPVDTRQELAKIAAVSHDTIAKVKEIDSRATPEQKEKIRSGDISINQAHKEIKRKEKEVEKENRREKNRAKVAMADSPEKIAEVGAKFSTIVIDPPWDWGDEGDVDQLGRARPDYATMSIDKLLELPVSSLADEDCHIYLWITNRSLPKGFALLEKWGFRYITCLTWVKPYYGMGNYFRGQTEQVLFGVKGSQMLKRKDIGTVFNASRGTGGHSSKPVEFLELVEKCSHSPYLEMFSRCDRDGWFAWGEGNE